MPVSLAFGVLGGCVIVLSLQRDAEDFAAWVPSQMSQSQARVVQAPSAEQRAGIAIEAHQG